MEHLTVFDLACKVVETTSANVVNTYTLTGSDWFLNGSIVTPAPVSVVTSTYEAVYNAFPQLGADIDGEAAGDKSGYSVSMSEDGSRVAIGAIINNDNGSNAGHVRIYKYDGSTWTQLGADIDGEAAGDQSGFSVSLSADGSRVAIGARENDGTGNTAGHVRIYEYVVTNDVGAWTQLGADVDGEAANDKSGWSVSLSANGTRVAIGAPENSGVTGYFSGHVRIFEYDGVGDWTQLGADIDGAFIEQTGSSVSLSADGSCVAIQSTGAPSGAQVQRRFRIFAYDGSVWNQLGADIYPGLNTSAPGSSVSLSADGSHVAFGIMSAPETCVRIFAYVGSDWTQLGDDIAAEEAGDQSGWSVSLSADGSRVAIGAMYNSGGGTGAGTGHVRIFEYVVINGVWTWNQLGLDIDGVAGWDHSGYSVSLSADGSHVAIGAPFHDGNGSDAGHVRIYTVSVNFAGTAGGATSGDPHIFPLRGNAYELPNKCCAYRMVQGKNLVVNANTRAVTQTEEQEIQAYYKQVTGEEAPESLVTNGVFYENVFIQSEGHVLEYSFDKKAGSHDAYFQVEQKEGKSTRTGEICPKRNYASVTFTHSVHGKTTIELNHFANPQLKHGMSCQFTRTTGLSGLLIEESNCKTMQCGLCSTKNVYGKGTNQLKNRLVLK